MRVLLVASALVFSLACMHAVRASGREAHQTREVPPFSGVSVASGIEATVVIGAQRPLELEGDEALLAELDVFVENEILYVGYRRGTSVRGGGEVRVRAVAPELSYLAASGGAGIHADGGAGESLEVEASGGGGVFVRNVDAAEVYASGSGGSHLELGGQTGRLVLEMSGGTKVRAGKLSARRAEVSGSGGSTAEVQVSEVIRGNLSGGSDVTVHGKASSRLSTSGGSEVHYDD